MQLERMMDDRTISGQQLWHWWQGARQAAIASEVPLVELEWLMQELCSIDRLTLRLESFKTRPQVTLDVTLADLDRLWTQRLRDRVPVQYLAGRVRWRRFCLQVSPAVLIPRPETEGMIDLVAAAVQHYPHLAAGAWADLGTGSGAIALALAQLLPEARIYAVDVSAEALAIAQANAVTCGLSDRLQVSQGSWFAGLPPEAMPLSGMVSNPPYIPTALLDELQPEVRDHEPSLALDGGADGLDCIRHLAAIAPRYLKIGGLWLVELMDGQGEAVRSLLQQTGQYDPIDIHLDLAGRQRFALAYRGQ